MTTDWFTNRFGEAACVECEELTIDCECPPEVPCHLPVMGLRPAGPQLPNQEVLPPTQEELNDALFAQLSTTDDKCAVVASALASGVPITTVREMLDYLETCHD